MFKSIVLFLNNKLINKLRSRAEVLEILKKLNNLTLLNKLSLYVEKWIDDLNHSDSSELKMKNLSENELVTYLKKIKTETLLFMGISRKPREKSYLSI